jgi:hypothetical protein
MWIFHGTYTEARSPETEVILDQFEFQKQNARILFPRKELIGTDAYQETPFLR